MRLLIVLAVLATGCATERDAIIQAMDSTVMIRTVTGTTGTGVVVISHGEVLVWTTRHGVPSNMDVPVIYFQQFDRQGRIVATAESLAFVVRSEKTENGDLALLRVLQPPSWAVGMRGFRREMPYPGERVFMVGQWEGRLEPWAVLFGNVCSTAQKVHGHPIYGSYTARLSAAPGCSGSGVYDSQGRCLGIVFALSGGSITAFIPAENISRWVAEKAMPYSGTIPWAY